MTISSTASVASAPTFSPPVSSAGNDNEQPAVREVPSAAHQARKTAIETTPATFLGEIFGPENVQSVWVCAGTDLDAPGAWTGRRFGGDGAGYLRGDTCNHYSIGLLRTEATRRSNNEVVGHYVVVADDVGTKFPVEKWDALFALGFPRPRFMVETSPGNYQYQFVIEGRPVVSPEDVRKLQIVRAAITRLGLGDDVMDDARYIKLPCGVNTKEKYVDAFGFAPKVGLAEYNAGSDLNLDDALDRLVGPDWRTKSDAELGLAGAVGGVSVAGALVRSASFDEPHVQLWQALGHDTVQVRGGVIEAPCPNIAAHTSREQTGFAFLGGGLMHCNHGHCQHLRTPDFQRKMREQYDATQAARVAAGLDLGGLPETASEFLARADFARHGAFSDGEVARTIEATDEIAAEMTAPPEWVAEMNEKHCLVEDVYGVVVLEPEDDGSLIGVRRSGHIREHHDGRRKVRVTVGGRTKEVGIASAWLDSPYARRYRHMDMWMPGQEPQGCLNLFNGLPKRSGHAAHGSARSVTNCNQVLDFIWNVIADGRSEVFGWVLFWIAWKIMHPLKKPGTNLVLIGAQGTGKGTLGWMLCDIFGSPYSLQVSQRQHALGRFNGHLEGKLFGFFDEAFFGRDPALIGAYKALTTEETMLVERKGIDARQIDNRLAILVASNELAAVPIEPGDRRATVVRVSDARKNDTAYFGSLKRAWIDGAREVFIEHCLRLDLTGFDPRVPLRTSEKIDAADATADAVTRWWLEVLESGAPPLGGPLDPSTPPVDWSAGPVTIANHDLAFTFETWARGQRLRHTPSRSELVNRIGQLCPARGARKRARVNGRLEWTYTYPALDDCRQSLNRALGGEISP